MTDLAQAKATIIGALLNDQPWTDGRLALAADFRSGALRIVSGEVEDALEAVAKAAKKVSDDFAWGDSGRVLLDAEFNEAILDEKLGLLEAARRKGGV